MLPVIDTEYVAKNESVDTLSFYLSN